MNAPIRRIRRAVKRENAERYLMVTLVSFAGAVILIRLFLELTGYPQVRNSKLHIAHVLWGGLLLFVATLVSAIRQPMGLLCGSVVSRDRNRTIHRRGRQV